MDDLNKEASDAAVENTLTSPSHVGRAVVLAVLLTALVVGGGVYAWQRMSNEQQITDLEAQILDMQKSKRGTEVEVINSETSSGSDPASTASIGQSVTIPDGWVRYINNENGFGFHHPADVGVGSNSYGVLDSTLADSIGISGLISVNSMSYPPPGKCAGITGTTVDLQEFAENIHKINVEDKSRISGKEVGPLEKTSIDNQPAYMFTVTKAIQHVCGGYLFDGELRLLYTEYNGDLFEIDFPANNPISQRIIDSFKFVR